MVIWVSALFLNAFSVALFAANLQNSVKTVYCPLTKKLQPLKVQKKEIRRNPFEEICADDKAKKSLADEFLAKNLLKTTFLDEKQFENLVFDFFQKGDSAFVNLPQFPDFPHKNSFKTFSVVIAFSNTNETQFVWKTQTENFNFTQNPRPPNSVAANLFEPPNCCKLEKTSRQISPRAPPFSL